jgi:hypothetical protein
MEFNKKIERSDTTSFQALTFQYSILFWTCLIGLFKGSQAGFD